MSVDIRSTLLLGVAAVLVAACGPAITGAPTAKPGSSSADAGGPKPLPARYVLTTSQGATFDEASKGVAVPRSEFAIVMGHRAKLDGGVIVASTRAPAGLVGFRSLPDRLGGGFLVWSDVRTYHAKDFLGALTPVAEIGPTAGARPWFGTILLRTERGVFELDLKARSVKRWQKQPGVVDALSIDDKRGVTVDIAGRPRATFDGGATWTDVTATKGFFANAARLGKKGEIELVSITGSTDFKLAPGASALEAIPPPAPTSYGRRYNQYSPYQYNGGYTPPPPPEPDGVDPISQQLAPDSLAWAASAGLLLDGDRAVVGRDAGGVQVISTKTGVELDSETLLNVSTEYLGCQPVRAGASLLLACAHAAGAHVLVFDGPVTSPKLEATFPDTGSFIADERGHLAHLGRCGRTPPSVDDFGARVAPRIPMGDDDGSGMYGGGYGPYGGGYGPYGGGYNPYGGGYDEEGYGTPEEPPEKEAPPADDMRICVRVGGGHWIERRITGDDAKDLYRFVLGDDGEVTALLLKGAKRDEGADDPDHPRDKDGPSIDLDEDDGPLRKPRSDHAAPAGDRGLLATQPASTSSPIAPPPPRPKSGGTASPSAPPAPKKGDTKKPDAKKPDTKKPEKKPDAKKPDAAPKIEPVKDGLRLVRLDPKDRALKKGKWTHVPGPQTQAPWRSLDRSFWLEADGSVRGWMHLEPEFGDDGGMSGDSREPPEVVSTEVSGRFAGVRVSPQGKVTVLPLPPHVQSVVFGGPYGFARADEDDFSAYYETTDGGATWTQVEGPPVGELEDMYDESRFPACSAVGCALSSGLVRLGWGSPKPLPFKKERDSYAGPGADAFPIPRLPKLECTFDGEPDAFPAPPPKPKSKTDPKPATATAATKPTKPSGIPDSVLAQLPPEIQDMIRDYGGTLPPELAGLLPPGLVPPSAFAPPAPSSSPSSAPSSAPSNAPVAPPPKAGAKPAKPLPAAKPPPPPPAEVVSIRSKPGSLGLIKDKSWVADFVVPFDATTAPKHVSISANGLEKNNGRVLPILGDRGVDLLLAWDKRRVTLGAASPAIVPFDYNGSFDVGVLLPGSTAKSAGPAIVAYDDGRHVFALLQGDASRAVLRTARIPDPTRGKLTLARRLDSPGVALLWYSATSGDVLAGAVDLGRAEVGPLDPLAGLGTLVAGDLAACSAKPAGPTYQVLLDVQMPVTVLAHSGKSLFSEGNVPVTLLVRADAERLCVAGVEARAGGRTIDLTATFGPKAAAVSRSRSSSEDPSKLSLDKLSCSLHEPESK